MEKTNNITFGFGMAIELLKLGKAVARKSWEGTKYVIKQINSSIPEDIIPRMTSLPPSVKELLLKSPSKVINYHEQCLIITQLEDGNYATNYIPDWVDVFSEDWYEVTL